jgi:hypothetical protein
MECSFLKGVSRLKNARIWWEVARRSGGARKFRVVRLVIDTVQGTGITKLNHTEFSRFIGRKQCFLSVFFCTHAGTPGIVFNYVLQAVSFSDCRPLFSVSYHYAVSLFCAAKVNVDVTGSSSSWRFIKNLHPLGSIQAVPVF